MKSKRKLENDLFIYFLAFFLFLIYFTVGKTISFNLNRNLKTHSIMIETEM